MARLSNFDKFKPKKIKKVIDPGFNDAPGPIKTRVSEPALQPIQEPESYQVLVADTIDLAFSTLSEVQDTIDNISSRNNKSPYFQAYKKLLDENIQDLRDISSPQEIKPQAANINLDIKLKSAERDVFRRLVDPRAAFLRDLYNMRNELALIESNFKNIWRDILETNNLYEVSGVNPVIQQVIAREQQKIFNLQLRNRAIKNSGSEMLNLAVAEAIGKKVFNRLILSKIDRNTIRWFRNTLRTLKQVRLLLVFKSFSESEEWETSATNLYKSFQDLRTTYFSMIERTKSYSIFIGIQENVEDFIADLIPEGLDLTPEDIPELISFRNKLSKMLLGNLKEVESDLISREGSVLRSEEIRNKLQVVAKENNKTKQEINLLDSIISYLEGLESILVNLQEIEQVFMESMETQLVQIIKANGEAFLNKVEW